MTLREHVLAAVRGEQTGRVPFTCYQGLLPEGAEAIESMALVTSAPVADMPTPGVSIRNEQIAADRIRQEMETPWGELTCDVQTEPGYGSSWTKQHWVKRPEDYRVIENVIRNAELQANPEPYRQVRESLGERGVVLAWTARAPLQRLWIEYTGIERLVYDLADCPQVVEGALAAMLEQSRTILRIAAESDAQLVWMPDNITGDVASPRLFEQYLIPYYEEVCEILLPAGKTPCCHMDGMLRTIEDSVGRTPLPVIEAFTPPPDGTLSVAEASRAWPEKTLWLNFPSSVHLSPPDEIARTTRELVDEAGGRGGFLIGVTENIPQSVGARSLQTIAEVLAE